MSTEVTGRTEEGLKDRVRSFWNAEPCGTNTSEARPGTPEFYREVEQRRYELEPYIPEFADFGATRGREVLEIGTGLGTDTLQFARAGATISGVDLTQASIDNVRARLALEGLEDRVGSFGVADAESLPFEDASFDRIYSWGVLHHTPGTQRAIDEAIRVLRPGGEVVIMLYGRDSWLAWRVWIRYALLRGNFRASVADMLSAHVESAGTKAYTNDELKRMFATLDGVRINSIRTVYDERYWGPIARALGNRFGWFRVIRGVKP